MFFSILIFLAALPVGSGKGVGRRLLEVDPHLKNPCRLTNFSRKGVLVTGIPTGKCLRGNNK